MAANLRLGSKGFLFRYVVSRNDCGPSWIFDHTFHLDCRGSMIFFSEPNHDMMPNWRVSRVHKISEYVTIRYISYTFASYRKDSSWDRPRSLDMNISRSPLDNLRHQTLVMNAMRILHDWLTYWNEWWTKLLFATFFSTRSKTPTNKTNWNGRKRSQTRTYKLHNDERRKQTHWKEFYSGPIRKYTLVDVGG